MAAQHRLPQVVAVRVVSDGGPFLAGKVLSLAFVDAAVGRLCDHEAQPAQPVSLDADAVPETIVVSLLGCAGPYAPGERLALSFLDPSAGVRIHHIASESSTVQAAPSAATTLEAHDAARLPVRIEPHKAPVFALEWTPARVERFVGMAEKLFAVDRLGWYRHALAMRLLLPDEISIHDPSVSERLGRELRALRIAATEALGIPLLVALMPNFSVDAEWLASIETANLARAASTLRESLRPLLPELDASPPSTIEAFLPVLIPADGPGELGKRVRDYRTTLLELFGQTAHATLAVRVSRLSLPNPALDDRLAGLVAELRTAAATPCVA